ncbi:hypothetical protein DFP72DRAFT_206384 [Ephemerocybe angulata]|uniref:Uncharacterized protein n=1 Tax=Ephemerocybe angulata TaxID=980116 RepID=A0A8H6MEK6_9AGAR|nr:hypothetical protein DFP72DRAFT_206384 [Tulosesus angulatus]
MRFLLFNLTALMVGLLASMSDAHSNNDLEARDIEYFLGQREILDAFSTRELVEELSGRLERRGLTHTKECDKCMGTFSYNEYDHHYQGCPGIKIVVNPPSRRR